MDSDRTNANPASSAPATPSARTRDFKRLRRGLVMAALCIAALGLAQLATSADGARRAALNEARSDTDHLAQSLSQHMAHGFHGVRVVLRMAAMDHADRLRRVADIAEMGPTLAGLAREAPLLRSMHILNGSGVAVADSRPAPAQPF
ncbi:MAG: hypothetical protein ACT4N4_14890, partial [Rhodospirillales bacterium]